MHADVYVIIPVYNEAPVIKSVIDEVLKKFQNVVSVDDGSNDGSVNEIIKTKALLVRHPINLGQGAALQTGIDSALRDNQAEYFVTFDADGQHQINDVERMLGILKQEKLDIVLGSRFLGQAQNMSVIKKIVLKAAVKFTNATSGLKLTDAHNGIRVFNRKVAEKLKIESPDMAHASEIIEKISQYNFKYKEVPVTITYSEYSRSKGQSIFNAVNIGLDVLFDKITK
jgi:polyprenyl-phospho-N-acetylgalactosaminyl synthase